MSRHTIYVKDADYDRALRVAKLLKAKNEQGLFKSDGSLNMSAIFRALIKNAEKSLKKD